MQYYLMNKNFELVDGIELFTSVIWNSRYYTAGDFELYIPATKKDFEFYTKAAEEHYYILRADEYTSDKLTQMHAMVIEKVELDNSYNELDHLIISGRCLKSLLSRRVVVEPTTIAGELEEQCRELVRLNAISPKDPDRSIPRLTFGSYAGITDLVNAQPNGGMLSDVITSLCKIHKVGWDILLNLKTKTFEFILYKGLDRSHGQSETNLSKRNPYVVFSTEFDNLAATTYTKDMETYKNVAYVHTTYTEQDEKTKSEYEVDYSDYIPAKKITFKPTGLDRYEIYIDANNNQIQNGNETKNYLNSLRLAMRTKGQSELEKTIITTEMTGDIVSNLQYVLNKDYFLGDVVTIENEYGLRMEARVSEIIESWDTSKKTITPGFTIENFTGKYKAEDNSQLSSSARITETGSNDYRISEEGETRRLYFGWVHTTRACLNERGILEERVLEDGTARACTDIEETQKLQEVVENG